MAPRPLLLDVDTGVDDAIALTYAAAASDVELIGATCVFGNVDVGRATRNTRAVLELCGLDHVEAVAGADRPLVRAWEPFPVAHGEEGLGAFLPTTPPAPATVDEAARWIVSAAASRPGELLLVATGPLTNIARAVDLEPALPEMLGGFALMGGAFREGGNVTPRAEANVWMDPDAAARVFAAWSGAAPAQLPRCLGLDVTERVVMTREHLTKVCAPAPDSPLARMIAEAIGFYLDFYESTGRFEGACMHDPLAVAAAIEPSLCAWAETRVEIETEGRWTRGETVTDLFGIRRSRWSDWAEEENAVVATSVDAAAVLERLVDRLRSLVEARA
jgi:purine nucleosidase